MNGRCCFRTKGSDLRVLSLRFGSDCVEEVNAFREESGFALASLEFGEDQAARNELAYNFGCKEIDGNQVRSDVGF